jgi:glycine/D-amino acid oxidase-like deaminating enzyme
MLTADVLIIGGGPAGASAAWAIDRAAPGTRMVLIERADHLGAGSSLASLEAYRTCWPAECLARQLARSVEVFHHADEYLGEGAFEAIHPKEQGYLFCAFTENQAAVFRRDVERLHAIGLAHIEYLNSGEVAYRFPWAGPRCIAAKFDPVAGWVDSNALIHRYIQSAAGLKVLLGVAETSITVEAGRVSGVATPHGHIAAPKVVIAAGANAGLVARTAGVELPVVLRPRQSFTVPWRHDAFPASSPMLIGGPPYPHVRPEADSGAIFGWEYGWRSGKVKAAGALPDALIEPIYPLEPLKDPRFPSLTLALLARQFGHGPGEGFGSPRYLAGVHHNIGYYVYRSAEAAYRAGPDGSRRAYDSERGLIDAVPGVAGLFVSTAHAGHGIMSSPGAGEIIASKVLGRPLPDPSFAAFGFDVPWVEYDESVL